MNAIQSVRLTEEFMELAKENTSNNLETCGILGASFVSVVATCQCDKHTEFSVWIFIFFFLFICRGMELTLWQCWLYQSKKELLTQYVSSWMVSIIYLIYQLFWQISACPTLKPSSFSKYSVRLLMRRRYMPYYQSSHFTLQDGFMYIF